MTSSLCTNKGDAKLEELLWYHDNMRLCTIYPKQNVDISSWLTYPYGRTYFPIYTNNHSGTSFQSDYKLYILVEADLESYKPSSATKATKIEDYGVIITWTATKNIDLIIESDMDMVAKFLSTAMEGQCYINNGLLLKRIETVLVSGKPCLYNNDLLNSPPTKRFIDKVEWEGHTERLRQLSDTAKIASEQSKSLEVTEFPDVVVYPETTGADIEIEFTQPIALNETLGTESRSEISTPASIYIPQQDNELSSNVTQVVTDNTIPFQGVSHSGSKSLDTLETLEESPNVKKPWQISCIDIKSTSKLSEQKDFVVVQESKVTPSKSNIKSSMAEITAKLLKTNIKPPNVLIYADSIIALNNVKGVLEEALGTDRYAIYGLSSEEARTDAWVENAALVVVCGNVGNEIGSLIVEYILKGGKLLALCSDVLHILLPSFKTAEVRENELVHFSYGKWKHVRMMHHIFCYQASPIRSRFSQDQEDVKASSMSPPTSANVKDKSGNLYSFDVKVLGTEETWHTPSILLASLPGNSGKVVFSQIHLEVDPMQYELEESKFKALKESNNARLEIFKDLLDIHLGIELCSSLQVPVTYTPAFFLGRHELKLEMLARLKDIMQQNDILKTSKLEVQFCRGSELSKSASSSFLPIMVHQCPDNFSTIEYFENLTTKELGRLVIYADIMTSSMDIVHDHQLHHGLVVIARQQTQGRGRRKNAWLSPKGCAMFTLHLHVKTNSTLGRSLSILQHLVSVAIVSAIKSLPGYEEIDLRLKWPNDIYAGNNVKIGGIVIETWVQSDMFTCYVGVGVNLDNKKPTCCINDIITVFNKMYNKNLKMITYEQYFAIVFNEIEKWMNIVNTEGLDRFLETYYTYWIHTDQEVTVISQAGVSQKAKILNIDCNGYLRVLQENGDINAVHPDYNSFDSLKGLIVPN
ncbi:holocarboxylase synthetase-like protein isoform X3 [Andrena cerasifolii]